MTRLLRRKLAREAWGMRVRILLLAGVVLIGVGVATTLLQSYENLRGSYDETYEATRFADLFVTLDEPRPRLSNPAAAFGARGLADLGPGLGRLSLDANVDLEGEEHKARLVGIPASAWPALNDVCLLRGGFDDKDYSCSAADKARNRLLPLGRPADAFVHAGFGQRYGLDVGDQLTLTAGARSYTFHVQGFGLNPEFMFATANPELLLPEWGSLGLLWVREDRLTDIARDLGYDPDGTGPLANEYFFQMTPGGRADKAERAVEAYQDAPHRFGDLHIRSFVDRANTYSYIMAESDVDGFQQITPISAGLVMLIAFSTIAITMERLVVRQQPIIGVLRALGTTRASIVWHYLSFALLVGALGSVAGIAAGTWGADAFSRYYQDVIGFPILHLGFAFWPQLAIAALATAACAAGGLRAARHAARMPIATAMREPEAARPSRWIKAATRRARLPLRLAVRNLTRAKRRSFFTVSGLTLSMVLAFAMFGLMTSSLNAIQGYFAQETWDGLVSVSPPQDADALEASLRGVGWVETVEAVVSVPANVEDMDEPIRLVGLRRNSMHELLPLSGASDFVGPDSLLATVGFRSTFQKETGRALAVGDAVDIVVDGRPHTVVLDGIVEEFYGATLYMPIETVQGYLGQSVATGAYVRVGSGRVADADDLREIPGFVALSEHAHMQRILSESLDYVVSFAVIVGLVGAGLGLVVVLNTSAVNLQERNNEHGTMKALGFSNRTLVGILAVENLVLGLLAAGLGTLLGLASTIAILETFTEEVAMELPLYIPWWHVVLMAAAVVVLAQAATLAAHRHLGRLDLPAIVKTRGS